jgi:photosystem II stability/assembly factor-like uncharacterized protein
MVDDVMDEPDETIQLTLSDAQRALLGQASHTITLADNDDPPMVGFVAATTEGLENGGRVTLELVLSAPSAYRIQVPYVLSGSAVRNTDYTASTGPLMVEPGFQNATLAITPLNNSTDEPDRTVIVTLGTPENAQPGSISEHTLTLVDDELTPVKLAFVVQPTNVLANGTFEPTIEVEVLDADNRRVTTASGGLLNLFLRNNIDGATLKGARSGAPLGVATFPTLKADLAGQGYQLLATMDGLTGALSDAFNVTASDWVRVSPDGASVFQLSVDPLNGTTYASTATRMWRLVDGLWKNVSLDITRPGLTIGVMAHPTLQGVVYATHSGRVWRSLDTGETWSAFSPLFEGNVYTAMTLGPTPTHYVAGNLSAGGIMRTDDDGATWVDCNDGLEASFPVGTVGVSPNNSQQAFVAFADGLYRTVDGGLAWQNVASGGAHRLSFDQHDDNRIFDVTTGVAAFSSDGGFTWQTVFSSSTVIDALIDRAQRDWVWLATTQGVLVSSDDNHDVWVDTSVGIPPGVRVLALAQDPQTSDVLYAGTELGVYRSLDAGAQWVPVSSGLHALRLTDLEGGGATAFRLFGGSAGALMTTDDAGGSWVTRSWPRPGTAVSHLAVDPLDSAWIWASESSDVYRTSDAGQTWSSSLINLPSIGRLHTPNSGVVYVGYSCGARVSQDGGDTWSAMTAPGTSCLNAIVASPVSPGTVYNVTGNNPVGTYRSLDYGASWTMMSTFSSNYLLVADSADANVVYAVGYDGILHKTVDGGVTWTAMRSTQVKHVAVAPSDANIVYASDSGSLLMSTDAGNTWVALDSGLPWDSATGIVIEPSNPRAVYVNINGYGIFKRISTVP